MRSYASQRKIRICPSLIRVSPTLAGKGLKVRTRLYLVSPQQQTSAECSEQLMEKSECEGTARPDCEFSAEDARLICGMKKEVQWSPLVRATDVRSKWM